MMLATILHTLTISLHHLHQPRPLTFLLKDLAMMGVIEPQDLQPLTLPGTVLPCLTIDTRIRIGLSQLVDICLSRCTINSALCQILCNCLGIDDQIPPGQADAYTHSTLHKWHQILKPEHVLGPEEASPERVRHAWVLRPEVPNQILICGSGLADREVVSDIWSVEQEAHGIDQQNRGYFML